MNPFVYERASSVEGAVASLGNEPTAKIVAGGTNLVDLMKERVARPTRLVDIGRLALSEITLHEDGGLSLGALVTNADTARDPRVKERFPLLSQAILAGASPQLRNMATNGGNLLQRTRCYYFYDVATPCNKRAPGSGCPAKSGLNRIHAILGASDDCIAVHPSDMCVALAALDARVRCEGPRGSRIIPFAEFHRLPGDTPHIDTTLANDELVVAIDLPPNRVAQHSYYLKLRDRQSYAFALVSVAAAVALGADGRIEDARLALGGVAHKPWRDVQVENALKGKSPEPAVFARAAAELLEGARGFGHNDFKIELTPRAVVKAFERALGSKRAGASVS